MARELMGQQWPWWDIPRIFMGIVSPEFGLLGAQVACVVFF
jgi:hypothetical protein